MPSISSSTPLRSLQAKHARWLVCRRNSCASDLYPPPAAPGLLQRFSFSEPFVECGSLLPPYEVTRVVSSLPESFDVPERLVAFHQARKRRQDRRTPNK